MKYLAMLHSILCIAVGAALCWHGREGWGWFLFVGVLVSCIPSSGEKTGGKAAEERTDER